MKTRLLALSHRKDHNALRAGLAAGCVALALGLTAHAQSEAPASVDPDLAAAHERLTARDDIQFARPSPQAEELAPARELPNVRAPRVSPFGDFLTAIGPFVRILFWVLIGLAMLAFLVFVVRRWLGRGSILGGEDSMPPPIEVTLAPDRPDARTARTRLEEADALAADGRYDEAVHLLLHSSHADLETARKSSLARSLTAREITGLSELSERARAALAPITALVERALFAGHSLGAPDYASARAAYQDFAFGMPSREVLSGLVPA